MILYREKGKVPLEHYFTNNENLKSELRKLVYKYEDKTLEFFSDNGVFAKDKIDYASRLLVETFIKEKCNKNSNGVILDVGCGYGFMGITVGKILNRKVELVDINKRALHLSERNIKLNEVDGKAYESNAYDCVKNKYEYIITNPPIRAGKEIVLNILKGAKDHLSDNGELWFVINKDQGAKSTANALKKCYNIEVVAKSKGFFVFKAKFN